MGMGGFMAGFGSAFSTAYQSGVDNQRQQENDMFKLRYSDYINRRDQYEKDDKERSKQINAAKSIVKITNQPEAAWGDFYNLLSSGMSYDDVYKMAQNNVAVVGPTVTAPTAQTGDNAPASPDQNLSANAAGAVDAQMQASGMQTPVDGGIFNTNMAQKPANQPTDAIGQQFSNMAPGSPGEVKTGPDGQNYQYAQTTGMQGATSDQGWIKTNMKPGEQDQGSKGPASKIGGFLHDMAARGSQKRMDATNARVDNRVAQAGNTSVDQYKQTMNRANSVQGTPVPGFPDTQVTWKPNGVANSKPDFAKIGTVGDAAYALTWANQFGSDQEKQYAKALYDQFSHLSSDQAKNRAIEMGTYQDSTRGAIKNPKTGEWDGGTAVKEPDGNGGFVWKDGMGNQVDEKSIYQYTPAMEKEIGDITKDSGKPVADYNKRLMDFNNLVRTSSDMDALVKQYPEAMGLSGDISQRTDALRRAGINVAKILNPDIDQEGNIMVDPNSAALQLEQAENEVMSQLKGPIDRNSQNALAATLIDIKATRLAYMWASMSGAGEGRAISNRDFTAWKDAAKGGENPEGLKISSADMIKQQYQSLKDEQKLLNENSSQIQNFKNRYHVPSPLQPAMGVDDMLNSDQKLKSDFERFMDVSSNNSLTQVKTTPDPKSMGMRPIGKTPDGKIVYQDENGKRYAF